MADVVYEIKISGLLDGVGGGFTMQDAMAEKKEPDTAKKPAFSTSSLVQGLQGKRSTASVIAGAGMFVAKKAISNYIQTIGLRTGNYHLQEQIDFGLGIASTIGGSTLAGALAGGIPGAIAGLTFSSANIAINSLFAEYNAGIKRDYSIQDASERQRVVNNASYGNNRLGGALY